MTPREANHVSHVCFSLPHEASGYETTNVGFLTQKIHTSGKNRISARQRLVVEQVRP